MAQLSIFVADPDSGWIKKPNERWANVVWDPGSLYNGPASQVRSLSDMSKDEIAALEKTYGCPVKTSEKR